MGRGLQGALAAGWQLTERATLVGWGAAGELRQALLGRLLKAVTGVPEHSQSCGDASTWEGSQGSCHAQLQRAGEPGAAIAPFHGWDSRTPRVWPMDSHQGCVQEAGAGPAWKHRGQKPFCQKVAP